MKNRPRRGGRILVIAREDRDSLRFRLYHDLVTQPQPLSASAIPDEAIIAATMEAQSKAMRILLKDIGLIYS